jgi:hypothetical protein
MGARAKNGEEERSKFKLQPAGLGSKATRRKRRPPAERLRRVSQNGGDEGIYAPVRRQSNPLTTINFLMLPKLAVIQTVIHEAS